MIQRRDCARFLLEPLVMRGFQAFDRDNASQRCIPRLPYLAHAPRADGREDLIGAQTVTYREGHGYWNNSTPQAFSDPD
jgi:hypothetical protein